MNRCGITNASRIVSIHAYVCALAALGLLAVGRAGWGQNQALDPVNVAGQGRTAPVAGPALGTAPAVAPAAAASVPVAATPPAATQAVVPVDVSTRPATPTAASPATPAAGPVVSTPPAPTTPAVPTTPATAASVPTTTTAPPTASTPVPTTPAATAAAPATAAVAPPTSAPATGAAPADAGPATVADGKPYPVTDILVNYKTPHPALPAISALLDSRIQLGVVDGGYVQPRPGVDVVTVRLADIGKSGPQKIYHSGVAAIYSHLLREMNGRGIIGVFVVVDPNDIKEDPSDPTHSKDQDVRKDHTSLTFQVVTSIVKNVRTVDLGDNSTGNRVNNPTDAYIREHSPLQPAAPGATVRNDLLRKDELDDYVLRLNRFPGRHVDVAISGTGDPGELNLDYLVSQNRSWYAFLQVANTGTSQTANFRERFDYVNNELTGHDDILSLDYSTADFSKSHAVVASYDLPFMNLDRVRFKTYGSWSQYTASDVGQNQQQFTGTGWSWGDELTLNFFQQRETFVDAVGGVKIEEAQTTNAAGNGLGFFIEPYLGLKLERVTDIASTLGDVKFIDYFSNTRQQELEGLGTTAPTRNPLILQYDFSHSFFLEPVLMPQQFYQGKSTLAHEVYFAVRGQYAFQNRLVPQAQDVAGGLYTVRGYPESIAAGDTVNMATLEYRFHVPRIFPVVEDPSKSPVFPWAKDFKFAPQTIYGRPDWDLILRAFVDAAQVDVSQRREFEKNQTLVGTGVGMELQVKQNFNLRIDWGIPLTSLKDEVTAGSSRFHITATILY